MPITRIILWGFLLGFLSPLASLAQPGLTEEVDKMAASLLEQLKYHESIKTVAIADFTDVDYHPNRLGRLLAEELKTSFIMAGKGQLNIINRSQLKALMKEVKLDADGLLAPDNIPRLGRLKSIDLIIGGTILPTYNDARVLTRGIELETGEELVAARGRITLTPTLKGLMEEPAEGKGKAPPNLEQLNASPPAPSTVKAGSLEVEVIGCSYSGEYLECRFKVRSPQADNVFSVFTSQSRVVHPASPSGGDVPFEMELGDKSGRGRVTQQLRAGQEAHLNVLVAAGGNAGGKATVELSCFSNIDGVFTLTLENVPIVK